MSIASMVKEQLKHNMAHKEKFYVCFDEFNLNRSENKLIKSTLLKLKNISRIQDNQKQIICLLNSFDGIDASTNFDYAFSKVVKIRSKEYENLMRWSKIFLYNKSFTTFSGTAAARSLLFPMERVFESYIASKLKLILSDKKWFVTSQDREYYLFDEPQKFALRPDIVIERESSDGPTVVLDTKWKRLIDNSLKNYGVSQADMYQMYVYSKKYNVPVIWVLYPCDS